MLPEPLTILGWARWLGLITCFAGAAWLDQKYRRVANSYWISWAKVAVFLWALELMVREAGWEIWATALAAVALASMSVIGRPTFKDIFAGNLMDVCVSMTYLIGLSGIVVGALSYGQVTPIDVLIGEASPEASLWWATVSVLVLVWIFEMMWKVRLIHGGADAKALMWVALLMPNWSTIPPLVYSDKWGESIIHMPPAISLLIWGALAFLAIPPLFILQNLRRGNISSLQDLGQAWHAQKVELNNIAGAHVWILDEVFDKADGSRSIRSRKRPPSKTPTEEQMLQQINDLRELGAESAWVSFKWPLLTFLFFAIIPMILFGDPFTFIMLPLLG
ncbi:MAG: hypothetical protein HOB52_05940 [Euryarchaeota archaeon]|nr:hypothetical protein [Euryarchaeota archaeon]